MILISSNFEEVDLVRYRDAKTYLLQCMHHRFGEDVSPVLCRTDDVVEEQIPVVFLGDVFGHLVII